MLRTSSSLVPSFTRLLLIIVFGLGGGLGAQEDKDDFYTRAGFAFENGDYKRAQNLYQNLIEAGDYSEDVFFNLGNALYRQNQFGLATLNFRRAQFFSPRMAEPAQNLAVLEKQVGFLKFEPKGIDAFLLKFRPSELFWIATLGGWIAAISLAAIFVVRRLREWRPLLIIGIVFGLALSVCAGFGWKERTTRLSTDNLAIVTVGQISARVAPTPDAEEVIALPPGSEVRMIVSRGPWVYIEVPGNLRGWVRGTDIEMIWPLENSA